MSEFGQSMAASASGMTAQSTRLRLSSENIANADTPGYRAKRTQFEQVMQNGMSRVQTGDIGLSQTELTQVYSPDHPMADGEGYYTGSNINLMLEIADARQAQRSYEANLKMFDQARQMASSLLDLLRR